MTDDEAKAPSLPTAARSEWRFCGPRANVGAAPGFSVEVYGDSSAIRASAGEAAEWFSRRDGPRRLELSTLAVAADAWLTRRGAPPLPTGWLARLTGDGVEAEAETPPR